MTSILNITNGDSAADLIREAEIAGEVLAWRDPMHHGPFPAGMELEDLSRIRIAYLSDGAEGTDSTTSHGFTLRDATLARFTDYDEVVLWFEHDLLDQLQILQILDYVGARSPGLANGTNQTDLSIICINRFAGIDVFRGLGQLNPEQIASLFPRRENVTQTQFQSAACAWEVFRQSTPLALQKLIAADIPGLPFMRSALQRHCQEFPWVQDGLSRTERQLLNLVSAGEERPARLFIKNMEFEDCLYIGDARTYTLIESLCNCDQPLLQLVDQEQPSLPFKHLYHPDVDFEEFKAQRLILTDCARRVLAGKSDACEFMVRNEYLGGVHQDGAQSRWLWNDTGQCFIEADRVNS